MTFVLNLLLFIVILGAIILIHEMGHFFFAKKFKVLCHDFSIGMGPALFQKRKGETLYAIRAIPLGGYVSMAGEQIEDAMFKKGDNIGLKLDENGVVKEIILAQNHEYDVIGKVVDYDLYGKQMAELFIELEVKNDESIENKRFVVDREAIYQVGKKRIYYITPEEKSFESKKIWQRVLIILAGPVMNFVFAIFIFLIMGFFVLKPQTDSSEIGTINAALRDGTDILAGDVITEINGNPINSWTDISDVMSKLYDTNVTVKVLRGEAYFSYDFDVAIAIQMAGFANYTSEGVITSDQAIVSLVQEQSRAAMAGLEVNDIISKIKIKGVDQGEINSWKDIINVFKNNDSGKIIITVLREGEEVNLDEFELFSKDAMIKLGAQPIAFQMGITVTEKFNFGYSLLYPFRAFGSNVASVWNTLVLLFNPKEAVGVKDLSGFVGIFTLVGKSREGGFLNVLNLIGFLSINVGFLNLLPIPALDGGRLIFLAYEGISRKKVNRKVENWINNIFFILLIVLMVYVLFNDIVRLVTGFAFL